MTTERFLIAELARLAGTTVRTIRYYTDEGLLPQPLTQGKYAYYTRQHLDRLKLIRRMKDAYLPLREIRQMINSLSDAEVSRRLAEPPAAAMDAIAPGSGSSALRYIARIIDEQAGYQPSTSTPLARPPLAGSQPQPGPTAAVPASSSGRENWQRITLAPGIELHLRQPAGASIDYRLQQLIAYAQKIFAEKGG